MSKIYIKGGAIIVEGVTTETLVINPAHFDYQKKGSDFYVRDGIENQSYNIGAYSDVENYLGIAFDSEVKLEEFLDRIINRTDVYVQDQATSVIEWFLTQKLNAVTLAIDAVRGEYTITLEPGHNCVIGNFLEFWDGVPFQAEIINVATNVITLAKPLPYNFTISETSIMRCNADINIDGSSTPVDFTFKPLNNLKYDIRSVSGLIASSGVPDDGKFGGATALTNGVIVGKINPTLPADGYSENIKDNFTMRLSGYEITYTDKAPAGVYGTEFIKIWPQTTGVLTRVDGYNGEYILAHIRDDLTLGNTGISVLRGMILGHIVQE